MTAPSPAGWYPDPSGQGQRYFDGTDWTPHQTPYLSDAQRTAILQAEIVRFTGLGARVLAQSSTSASLESGQPVNHVIRLLITVLLCGLWLPIWLIIAATDKGVRHHQVTVDEYGGVHWTNPLAQWSRQAAAGRG
jgi:hypothetical protein